MDELYNEFEKLIRVGRADAQVADSILRDLAGKPIHIYGALGRSAKLLVNRLTDLDIHITGGFDRKVQDPRGEEHDFPVRPSAAVSELGTNEILIVAAGAAQLFQSMEAEIRDRCGAAAPRIIDGRKLVYVLQNLHCAKLAQGGKHEDLMTCVSYHTKPFKCEYFNRATEKLAAQEVPQEIKSTGAKFNSVGYLISEWCNLRCAQCCEAVPYLDSKEMVPVEEIVADLKKLTASIKFLHRLDIVGGEPFAHKQIVDIIREVKKLPGIGYIAVFTNGTIMPPDELCEILVSPRIIVTNSDYSQSLTDDKRQKIQKTAEKLRNHGVRVIQIADRYWFDLINFKPNGVSDEQLEKNYADCFLESCRRLYRGTLFHCAFQANGVKLGIIPKNNVVELHAAPAEEVCQDLEKFEREKFIDSCRYCALPIGAKEVVAAFQLKGRTIPVIEK